VTTRQEIRRLALIGKPRLKLVIGTRGNHKLFLQVPVEIAKDQGKGTVGVMNPAVEAGDDVLSSGELGLRYVSLRQILGTTVYKPAAARIATPTLMGTGSHFYSPAFSSFFRAATRCW
jgi:hypothetical protein